MWRSNQRRMLSFALVLSIIGYSCSEDPSAPPPPPNNNGGDPLVHDWSQRFGDASNQTARSATLDGSGNVIVTGQFSNTVNFGGGILTAAGNGDVFIVKFDAGGNHLWSKRFGDGGSPQGGYFATVDASGNVFVTGRFLGAVNFGGGVLTSAGLSDVFVAKFDAAGNHVWSSRFGDASDQWGVSSAIDGAGNVIVTGYFEGAADFGGGVLTSAGLNDIFVAKFDAGGNHLWSKRFGDEYTQIATSAAVDGSDNVILTGYFVSTVDFGGGVLTSAGGGDDIFVAKFDAAGNHVWSKHYGDVSFQEGLSAAVDGSGNVIVTGSFQGAVNFGGGVLTSAGNTDIYVVKFNASGNHIWSKRYGDASFQEGLSTAVDGAGNVIVTGSFQGALNFGGDVLTSAGSVDIFLAKFSPTGKHLGSKRFGDANSEIGLSVDMDDSGNVIATGTFQGTLDFGGGLLTGAGALDIFLARFVEVP